VDAEALCAEVLQAESQQSMGLSVQARACPACHRTHVGFQMPHKLR
jgi:hypothetical protein